MVARRDYLRRALAAIQIQQELQRLQGSAYCARTIAALTAAMAKPTTAATPAEAAPLLPAGVVDGLGLLDAGAGAGVPGQYPVPP